MGHEQSYMTEHKNNSLAGEFNYSPTHEGLNAPFLGTIL